MITPINTVAPGLAPQRARAESATPEAAAPEEKAPASSSPFEADEANQARDALAALAGAAEGLALPEDRTIEFSYDDSVRRIVVKVKNPDGEVVRQIPPEDALAMAARFREMFGVLFDEVA